VRVFICSAGSEPALLDELERQGATGARVFAAGVVAAEVDGLVDPVFARQQLREARAVEGRSIRELAEAAFSCVDAAIDDSTGGIALHAFTGADRAPGLGSRATLVGEALVALLRERRRRAARRLEPPGAVPGTLTAGATLVQLLMLTRERLVVSAASPHALPRGGFDLAPWPAGDAPVAIDRGPPSRAYQKLEEAFRWMGTEPRPGEVCIDLGASPGGWTATALKRRARVVAVDRAPLAPPLARDPRVTTVIGNAFSYAPAEPADWLLSDVVCEPPRSLALIERYLTEGLCRNLVVTVKFKGRSGYRVLDRLPTLFSQLNLRFARVKQLAHNKNEVTVMARA
jgi:23S rRNA (cytidine2498-2'-O)-methyltransferase